MSAYLTRTIDRPDWFDVAPCRGVNPAVFVPNGDDPELFAAARKFCDGCPLKAECLDYALSTPGIAHGMWGGTTEKQRRSIKRARQTARRMNRTVTA